MRRSGSGAFVLALVGVPAALPGQSALLSAVEGSAPAPVVEPTAGVFPVGVAGLWSDPTSSPRVTGAFFGVYQASRASFRIYHAAVAFRWGPRWSLTYGQSEIGNLFDTSLTNIDPGLASLQARALWGSFDGTVSWRRLSGSVGIGLAGDDNVGDVQSSTTARVHLRVTPLRGISIGVRTARAIGGSVPNTHRGRSNVDVLVIRSGAFLGVSMAAAVSRGSFWRFAETNGGVAARARSGRRTVHDDLWGDERRMVSLGRRGAVSPRHTGRRALHRNRAWGWVGVRHFNRIRVRASLSQATSATAAIA